jgi:hypothetical protein
VLPGPLRERKTPNLNSSAACDRSENVKKVKAIATRTITLLVFICLPPFNENISDTADMVYG